MPEKLQHLLAALLISAPLGPAHALTLDIGDLLSEGPVTLSRAFSAEKSFANLFAFALSEEAKVTFEWSSVNVAGLKLGAPDGIAITSPGLQLVTDPLASGPYNATFAGLASPGSSYQITISASPAPEPAAWMLFAAGLALVGVIARKRVK